MQKIFIKLSFLFAFFSSYNANAQCKAIMDYLIYDSTNTTLFYNQGSTGSGYGYVWDFGDGTGKSTTERANHKYAMAGTYKITFIVYNTSLKCADTTYSTIVDKGKNPCNAQFTVVQDKSNPLTYHYSAKDSAQDNYEWWSPSYGYKKNLTHTFSSEGSYQAILYVQSTKNHCIDTVKKYLYAKNCSADFSASVNQSTKKVTFTNKSSSSTVHFYWLFGNVSGWDTLKNPSYTYSKPGKYWVTLMAWDKTYACMDSAHLIITVNGCDADFTINQVSKSSGIYRLKSPYKASSSIKHAWYLSTKTSWTGDSLILNFGSGSGSVTVCHKLIDSINNCSDSVCKKVVYGKTACDSSFTYRVSNDSLYYTYTGSSTKALNWDFGTGYTIDTSKHITQGSYQFPTYGTYQFCLRAYCSASSFSVNCVQVTINQKCDAKYIYKPDATNKLRIDFYPSYFGSQQHKWYFGDGNTSAGPNPSHTYSVSKSYNVCHVIYDSIYKKGCKDSVCQTLTICNLKVDFSSKLIASKTIEFADLSSLTKYNTYWSFGDGNYSSAKKPTHTYTSPGFYRVTLFIDDSTSSCSDSISKLVLVTHKGQKCTADVTVIRFSSDPSKWYFYSVRDTVGVLHKWTVDGVKDSSNTAAMIRIFPNAGTYRICLYLDDTINKCKDTICTNIGVSAKCNADFTYKPDTKYKINFTSLFNGSSTTKYYWTFGNGKTSTSKNPNSTYDSIGNYTVCLYLDDTATKCRDTVCKTISVKKPECDSMFSYAVMGDSLYFTYQGNSPKIRYDFGDSKTSTSKSGMHIYIKPGTYTVCLTADCSGDSSKYCISITIKPKCKALYSIALDTTQKFKLFLINKSSNTSSTQYTWDFGDGSYSGNRNPSHKYSKFGKYAVCLIVVDTAINCSSKYCDTLGLDSNGKLLKAGAWELVVIDEKVFGVKKIVKSDFKIYPNPANTKVTIDLSNATNSYQNLEILNANGQVCIFQPIEKGSETIEVDLERISRGLYLIKLSNDDGYSYRKLMKN